MSKTPILKPKPMPILATTPTFLLIKNLPKLQPLVLTKTKYTYIKTNKELLENLKCLRIDTEKEHECSSWDESFETISFELEIHDIGNGFLLPKFNTKN